MTDDGKSSRTTGGWVRITWNPGSGVVLVSGDCAGILGVSARRLINSRDPLSLLPPELTAFLSGGLPEVPGQFSTTSFTGTISTVGDKAEIILFDTPQFHRGGNILLDELGAGVVGTDRSGTIIVWNRAMTTIFRIPQQHAVGKQIQDVLTAPVLYSWDNVIQMVLDGKNVRVECRPDGMRRIESTFSAGGPGIVGTCFDTTESFQAESRLRTSRKMNQAYFHSVSTGLVLFDKDYRILVANKAFGIMFGLVENLLGIHLNEILPRESFAIIEDLTLLLFQGRATETEEARVVRFVLPDETAKVVLQNIRPIVEESGEVFYAVGIFEDMSEKYGLQDEYRRYRARVDKIGSIISMVMQPQSVEWDEIAELIRECLSAKAVAVYTSDHLSNNILAGKTDRWPEGVVGSFSDLRMSSFMLESRSQYLLSGDEIGLLNAWFRDCMVFPIESDRKNYGFIVAAETENPSEPPIRMLAELISSIMQLALTITDFSAELSQLDLLLGRQSKLAGTIISVLDIPVAVFRTDWSVILWNEPMEELTGVSVDLATSRSELAANILFDNIGGISSAQRLARNGLVEFPESWIVSNQDGVETRCSWRISRTESVEGGNLEPVIIVSGVKSDDTFSVLAAKKAAEMYTSLSRGTSSLLSAPDRMRVEEAAATAFLEISGASRITLNIRGMHPISRTSYEPRTDVDSTRKWKLSLETDTETLGECLFSGGKEYPVLRDYARNVARTCAELEKAAIGRRLTKIIERAAGKFFITNSTGRMLLSTWVNLTEGVSSNRTIFEIFSGSEWSHIESMLFSVLRNGRQDMRLSTSSGTEMDITAAALDGQNSEPLILWWPVSSSSYMDNFTNRKTGIEAGNDLQRALEALSVSIRSGFIRIREVLNPDHPVAAVLNTSRYAFEGLSRSYIYLRLLSQSISYLPERVDVEYFLDTVKSSFLTDGLMLPDITISGEVAEILGNADLMQKITVRICRVAYSDSNPDLSVSVVDKKEIEAPGEYTKGTDRFVRILLRNSDLFNRYSLSDDLNHLPEDYDFSTGLDPIDELAILSLILRISGGILRHSVESSTLIVYFPCWN